MPNWVQVSLKKQQYNLLGTNDMPHYNKGVGIELVGEGNGTPYDEWKIDLDIWPHLGKGVLKNLSNTPAANPDVSMKWATNMPNIPLMTITKRSKLASYNLMGSRIISIDADASVNRANVAVQKAAKKIYEQWPGSFELTHNDPRHIGTHSHSQLGTYHKHIVKKDGSIWTGPDLQKLEDILKAVRAVYV